MASIQRGYHWKASSFAGSGRRCTEQSHGTFRSYEAGYSNCLDDEGSHLVDKASKEEIGLNWRGGTPVMRVEVLKPLGEDRAICAVDEVDTDKSKTFVPSSDSPGASSSSAEKPFPRQAHQ